MSETPTPRTVVWPADYYSGASRPPVLPQWATFGCGAVAVLILVLVFMGGAFFFEIMKFAIGMSVSEMKGLYAPDVSATAKKSLDAELDKMVKHLNAEEVTIVSLQPFLKSMREVTSDRKIDAKEAATLEAMVKKINAAAKPKPKSQPARSTPTG